MPSARQADCVPWAFRRLPVLPATALELVTAAAQADWKVEDLTDTIIKDPTLTAGVLREANSAATHQLEAVKTIEKAIIVLGSERLHQFALTIAMRDFFCEIEESPGLLRCWRHSQAVGLAARALAPLFHQSSRVSYTCGLLHDIGALALIACHAEEYDDLLETLGPCTAMELLGAERSLFDVDHCTAGAWFARRWKLPPGFCEAAAQHHDEPSAENGLVSLITIADRISVLAGYSSMANGQGDETIEDLARLVKQCTGRGADESRAAVESAAAAVKEQLP